MLVRCGAVDTPKGTVFPVVEVSTHRGRLADVRVVKPAELLKLTERGEQIIPGAGITEEKIRACFHGYALARAHAVAALSPVHHAIIYGTSRDQRGEESSRYNNGQLLLQIGRIVTDHCRAHRTRDADCKDCADHVWACEQLKHAGFPVLREAMRHTDPFKQAACLLAVQVDVVHAKSKRRQKMMARRAARQNGARSTNV